MLPTPNLMLANQIIEERQAEARRYARQGALLRTVNVQPSKWQLPWSFPWQQSKLESRG